MKRTTIRWIIGMMSVALLGLIGFQWYWIDSVIRSNEERFKRDVLEALHAVSEKLEKQEALYTYHQQMAYRSNVPFGTFPGRGRRGSNEFPDSYSGKQLQSLDTLFDTEGFGFNIYFDFSTGSVVRSEMNVQELMQVEQERLEKIRQGQFYDLRSLQEKMERVTRKSEMVFEVLENILLPDRSLLSRFNPMQLDSLLRFELSDRGINISFDYAVVSPGQNKFVLLRDHAAREELQKSELRANLFPNDIIGDPKWLVVNFPEKQRFLLKKIWMTMASSGLLVLVIVCSFGYSIHTILRQKKLSEIKNDFINNMTHELKTPIATISLAAEALSDQEISSSHGLKDRYLKIISEENKRLGEQVERVLNMAALDRNDIELKCEDLDMESLILAAIDKTLIQVEQKGGTIKFIDNAKSKAVFGDKTHLINIFVNLLDNANKYSPDTPAISIRLFNKHDQLFVAVQDHGIGMSKEAVSQIFQKFYRVPTGNIHNVKGFGLGLAYVKTMTELHHGKVWVESQPGRGSKFIISLPLYYGEA